MKKAASKHMEDVLKIFKDRVLRCFEFLKNNAKEFLV